MWAYKNQLVAQICKLEETQNDIDAGRTSRAHAPILVAPLGRNRYFILDGHHRALEAQGAIEIEESPHYDRHSPTVRGMLASSIGVRAFINQRAPDKTKGR